jgi:hypothetical protein
MNKYQSERINENRTVEFNKNLSSKEIVSVDLLKKLRYSRLHQITTFASPKAFEKRSESLDDLCLE